MSSERKAHRYKTPTPQRHKHRMKERENKKQINRYLLERYGRNWTTKDREHTQKKKTALAGP